MSACGRSLVLQGVPSPVKHPEKVDMVIFRENTEDIYAGIEFAAGSPEAQKLLDFLAKDFRRISARFVSARSRAVRTWQAQLEAIGAPNRELGVEVGIGIKPVSRLGTERLVAQRDRVRHQEQAQERHAGAQGQHHEVHRRRLPRLGLPGRQGVLRRAGDRRGTRGARFRREAGRRHRHQGRDRRHHPPAGADPPGRVRRHRDARI